MVLYTCPNHVLHMIFHTRLLHFSHVVGESRLSMTVQESIYYYVSGPGSPGTDHDPVVVHLLHSCCIWGHVTNKNKTKKFLMTGTLSPMLKHLLVLHVQTQAYVHACVYSVIAKQS